MKVVVFNSSNVVTNGAGVPNGTLQFFFPSGGVYISKKSTFVALAYLSIPYSWPNISPALNNTTFSYTWYVGDVLTVFNVTIPQGIYEIADINTFLEYTMIQNNTYLQPAPGAAVPVTNLYFVSLAVNPTRYAIQLNTYQVPTLDNVPAGYQFPTPEIAPTAPFNPQVSWQRASIQNGVVTYETTGSFNRIVGYGSTFVSDSNPENLSPYNVQNYSASSKGTTISYLSNTAPNLQPYGSPAIALVQAENNYTVPNNIIYSFPSSSDNGVGTNITITPPNFLWTPLSGGNQTLLQLSLLGQGPDGQYVPLPFVDPALTIVLAIEDASELNPHTIK
jgi:hypothetical protein